MVQLQPKPQNRQKERWKTFDWDMYTKALVKEHPQEIVVLSAFVKGSFRRISKARLSREIHALMS